MKSFIRPLALLGLAALLASSPKSPSLQANENFRVASRGPREAAPQRAVREGELLVQFASDVDDRDASRMMRGAGAREARRGLRAGFFLATVDDGFTTAETMDRLRRTPGVEYAEPNGIVRAFLRPNDQFFASQWHMRMLNAERTWDIQTGDPSVVVAVLDTGIAYEDFGPYRKAPDFGNTVFVAGFDFVNNDTHPNDDNFHGTHVSSTVAESTNNGVGVAGLAFGCALMPVKVLDEEGNGTFFEIVQGIDFAARNPQVKVINMSLGGDDPGPNGQSIRNAITRAVNAGITVVAAAGNDGRGNVSFPALIDNVIAVGAVDGRKQRASYSNFGSAVDLMAPGGDTDRDDTGPNLTPDGRPDGVLQQTFSPFTATTQGRFDDFGYFFVDGTSQASPHVAALAALLYRQGITKPAAIQAAMQKTAEDLGSTGRDNTFGFGLIQPVAALSGLGLNR